MAKILKQREATIPKEDMEEIAQYNVSVNTTNADVFQIVRSITQQAVDGNAKITNIGELYWYLLETRDKFLSGK